MADLKIFILLNINLQFRLNNNFGNWQKSQYEL